MKFEKSLLFTVILSLFLISCNNGAAVPDAKKENTPVKSFHGLTEDRTVSAVINGKSCLLKLNAENGSCKIVSVTESRAVEGEEIDAQFEFYNGRLSIKTQENSEEVLGSVKAEEDDSLFITLKVTDIDSETPQAEDDSVKICNDSDMDSSESNADAKVDYETEAFINKQLSDPYTLPERSGTNYFINKVIYERSAVTGETAKDRKREIVTEDDFWGRDYSYKVVIDNDDYAIGLVYWKSRYEADVDSVQDACRSQESFEDWLPNNKDRFDGLKVDASLGLYGSVQKYLRAYYGLSDDCSDDEVITVYFRNFLEKVNRERHIEMQAFWYDKSNGFLNLIMTTEPGLTCREQFEINNPWPLLNAENSFHVLPGGKTVCVNMGPNKAGLNGDYNIISVTDNTITFIDTSKDWPVRYNILYTEMEYKPEWTGYFMPAGNGWQNEIPEGVKSSMMCEALWGDTEYHVCASGSGLTGTFYIDGEYTGEEKTPVEETPSSPAGTSELKVTNYALTEIEETDLVAALSVTNQYGFYSFNTSSYQTVENGFICFKLKNMSDTETLNYRIHVAWVDDKEICIKTLAPNESADYCFKISDILAFINDSEKALNLEIFCDSNIVVEDAKVIKIVK